MIKSVPNIKLLEHQNNMVLRDNIALAFLLELGRKKRVLINNLPKPLLSENELKNKEFQSIFNIKLIELGIFLKFKSLA